MCIRKEVISSFARLSLVMRIIHTNAIAITRKPCVVSTLSNMTIRAMFVLPKRLAVSRAILSTARAL